MKVKIWSDIRCPFCYIGKRKFEKALEQFEFRDELELNWKSYELDPTLKTDPEKNLYDYFSEIKGVSREQAVQMNEQVTGIAREIGLEFNMDHAKVANSYRAHKLIQYAKKKGFANEMEEALFKAYFTDSNNIDDENVLNEIGGSLGISQEEMSKIFDSTELDEAVKQDQMEARAIGVRGVPFFVFDDRYAVSGAQSPETFLQVLNQVMQERKTA